MDPETANQAIKLSPKNGANADIVDSMSKVSLDDGHPETLDKRTMGQPTRRLVIYPRPQILRLSKSPLVKPPVNMPALKDWFGLENEQTVHKKDGEGSSPTGARDRRFRRDPEDGDAPPRPSFRVTQPSQMGNFKHQSLRSTDRGDRDKEGDKERERDIRDKEGQERLRNLSDKYDRDRLALPSNLTSHRNKERDSAPHLNAGSSRLAAREIASNATSRRPEAREGAKKKIEASEDWRRGADPNRPGRDDRPDHPRKDRDRDDRDRPRSRARDISRPRRERSTSRRDDRDKDRDRRGDRDRDDYRRGDRDDYRREREDNIRRDRDLDRDDDPRRWRDDGKRDERLAARREREYRDRVRDRPPREEGWELSNDRHGGRWTVVEERDTRNKRSSGRDRRSGVPDEAKEKDDRKDRERDRDKEREKEPAWMDTYIPSESGAGILSGIAGEGELDGIQAFKKGMKAKEQKETPSPEDSREPNLLGSSPKVETVPSVALSSDKPLDEIQLFKLMMKKEREQKVPEKPQVPPPEPILTGPTVQEVESAAPSITRIKEQRKISMLSNGEPAIPSDPEPHSALDQSALTVGVSSIPIPDNSSSHTSSDTPQALLSILSSVVNGTGSAALPTSQPTTPSLDTTPPKPTGSRFFPKPLASDVSSPIISEQGSSSSQAPPQFNPPPGSRLLAFGARNTSGISGAPNMNQPPLQTSHGLHPPLPQHVAVQSPPDFQGGGMSQPQSSDAHRPAMSEVTRTQQGFSPFELQSRAVFSLDESQEPGNYSHNPDFLRRTSIASSADRTTLSVTSDSNNYFSANSDNFTLNGPSQSFDPMSNGSQYTTGKSSRFLKYFEDKGRDGQTSAIRKPQGPVGFQSSSPNLGQRQEQGGFSGIHGGHGESRAVDELVAMLNTSGQRGNGLQGPGAASGGPFGQHNSMQSLHHHQQQQQMPPNSRLDSLYESRMDDRNFVPDSMVPGLRQVPRGRENNGMFTDQLDDPMQFNPHRIPPQQRGLDHNMYPGAAPPMYAQHGNIGRNSGIPMQQPQFRGNPSPNPLQGPQRLPPGLANLGGRPPHEPSQFIGAPIGMQQSAGMHGPVHGNGPTPQPYSNFGANGGLGGNLGGGLGGFVGTQMRAHPSAQQIPNSLGQNQMGHPVGSMDLRVPTNQAQLLSLGGGPNIGGLRGGFGPQGPPGQMQAPLLAMRQQQQQQHLPPPHMMPHQAHHIPPHLQHNTQDLMALLMGGGPHRE